MADEAPFQFLHQELIQYIYKSSQEGEVRNLIGLMSDESILTVSSSFTQESGRNITKLENLGFRVGQGLIER